MYIYVYMLYKYIYVIVFIYVYIWLKPFWLKHLRAQGLRSLNSFGVIKTVSGEGIARARSRCGEIRCAQISIVAVGWSLVSPSSIKGGLKRLRGSHVFYAGVLYCSSEGGGRVD